MNTPTLSAMNADRAERKGRTTTVRVLIHDGVLHSVHGTINAATNTARANNMKRGSFDVAPLTITLTADGVAKAMNATMHRARSSPGGDSINIRD
jgi:hypothetical protein